MQTKVLAITSVGYADGGVETILIKIRPYLSVKGYNVKTLTSDLKADKEYFGDYTFKSFNHTGPLKFFFFLFNPSSFFVLKKLLKEYKPDIIHLHTMNQITPSALFLLKKYPTVMTLHGPESFLSKLLLWFLQPWNFNKHVYRKEGLNMIGKFTYFYFNSIQKFLYKFTLKNVDVFTAPSKYIQNMAKTDVSPIIHLPNFIDLQKFHELTNNYNLLFVGRLEKMKGTEFLIRAISLIINVFPQTTLTIVGDGPDKADLFNLTNKLQLEKYIQFVGWVEHKDLDTYYEKASSVVVPSSWVEAFGIVILEAMSAGRPVIATNIGGIPEIIDDGVNGYLVKPENPEQIAEKVIKLFSEESLLKDLGRNARKKAEEFSIDKYVDNLEKIYIEVMSKYKLK
jgi:glycosyltransferase involved in cell wall biosynthesis